MIDDYGLGYGEMSNNSFDAEKVSCCMDGDSIDYLDQLCVNEKARACWSRFHFIRSFMKSAESTVLLKEDFHTRVMTALEKEPTVFAPRLLNQRKHLVVRQILKPVAGLAIAASVAAVVVTGFQNLYTPVSTPTLADTPTPSATLTKQQLAQQNSMVSDEAEMILASDSLNEDLDTYLLGHMEQSASGGNAQGMLPYVRMAGFNDNP